MNKKQANAIISRHEELVVVSTYNILFTNDIACGQVIEAINVMKRTPLYKQKTKQLLNSTLKAQRDYESVLNSVIGDRCDFFANANESFCEEVMRHVEILYWCIKREFDRYTLPYPPPTGKDGGGTDTVPLLLRAVRQTPGRPCRYRPDVQAFPTGLYTAHEPDPSAG